ncbi:hypothetical protein IJI55_03010, partial [Candidatus Saccharibacteria bacterium]|nr:hypothetical protein [Candidatus Saccharibacteria bacterium]
GYTLTNLGDNPSQSTLNSTTFSKVELTSSSADSLISSGSKTTGAGDNLPVTYGFMADTKLTPGTYSTQVTYTAIAETPSYTISSVSPSELYTNDQTDKTITILTTTPVSELGLGDITATITNGTDTVNLTNCSEITSNGYRGATCTFPGGLAMGYYNVTLTSSWHSATYTLTNGFRVRDYRTMSNITYMQDMNSDICENTPETQSYSSAPTLTDSRGKGNAGSQTGTYKVIKAKDGNCWMADNLNLYNMTGNNAITSTNSDIPSGSYEIPDGITQTSQWSSNIYDRPMIEVAHGVGDYADKTNQYGTWGEVYYNWCAATATSGTSSINCNTTTPPNTSICPKGWTLPINGDKNVNKSWAKLLDKYGITTGAQLTSNGILGFTKYYGGWDYISISEYGPSFLSRFWSGTPFTETRACDLRYTPEDASPQRTESNKGYGYSIKCVSK